MPRKKTRSRRRTTKKKGFSLWRWIGFVLLMGAAGGGFYWLTQVQMRFPNANAEAAIEAILLGGGVDLKKDLQKTKDETGHPHWKVEVSNQKSASNIANGLEQWVSARGGTFKTKDAQRINGKMHQLVTLEMGANRLKIIMAIGKTETRKKLASKPKPEPNEPEPAKVTQSSSPLDPPMPKVAIILDDIGGKPLDSLDLVLETKYPVTFAVLPFLAYSTNVATALHQKHYEVMLHMPMEPENFPKTNPGKGAIHAHLNRQEILEAMDQAIRSVPFISGVNNHMGSKITANRSLMEIILTDLKQRDLYFIDSRTHKTTVAFETARRLGLNTAERQVFLDSDNTYEFTMKQFEEIRLRTQAGEDIIAIGHPYPSTLKVLAEMMPILDREGVQFVFASELTTY